MLAGGRSGEHEVSLRSAAAVRDGLAAGGHEVLAVELARDGSWTFAGEDVVLLPGKGLLGADVVFPVLHGPYGEDGTVQGLLELLDVPYVGSGVMASAVCLDKLVLKDLMAAHGVAQVAYAAAPGEGEGERLAWEHGYPCWVKPARMGSSVGISRVEDAGALPAAIAAAREIDRRVIIEAHCAGVEVECAILGDQASEAGEITITADWYDFEAKYTPGAMELVVPARITPAAGEQVRALALRAFALADCAGLARVDFFVDGDRVLLNEINTMPGFTVTSVYPKLWEASGVQFTELVQRLCDLARAT